MYTIQAIPTVYKGRRYRSRLEAKWAAFFDLLGWKHEYEPADLGPWSPDFALIRRKGGVIYVEVKPISDLDLTVARKMVKCPGEHLLVGISPGLKGRGYSGLNLGWLCNGEPGALWCTDDGITEPAEVTRIHDGDRAPWGIISTPGSYGDRISGIGDGDHHLAPTDLNEVEELWARASNAVQWHKRPRKAA